MSLRVGKEFPNKAPTNINPEKMGTFPFKKKIIMLYIASAYMNVLKE